MAEDSKKADSKSKLKEVHRVWGPVEAEVIKSLFKSHGIPCTCRGLVVQSVHAFSMDGMGEIKIFVHEKDYETAKKLLGSK